MRGFIADHPQRMQPLQHDVANQLHKGRGLELLEKAITWFTGQAQIPVEHPHQHLCKATQLDHGGMRVSKHIAFCQRGMLIQLGPARLQRGKVIRNHSFPLLDRATASRIH